MDHAKSLGALLSQDGLHMNDLGYRCLAHALAEAIENAAGASFSSRLAVLRTVSGLPVF